MSRKFCPNCGYENPGEAAFCSSCGHKFEDREPGNGYSDEPGEIRGRSAGASGGSKAKIVIPIVLILLLLGAGGFYWLNSTKSIEVDLTAGIPKTAIIATGEDGSGVVELDEVAMKNGADYPRGDKRAEKFMKTVRYEADQMEKLNNDDVINVTAVYSESTAKKYHIDVKNEPRKFTIRGLTEKEEEKEEEEEEKKETTGNVTINLYGADATDVFDNYQRYVQDYDYTDTLTADQAQKAINDIYARHGYIFQNAEWRAYYETKSWYTGVYTDQADAKAEMTDVELSNLEYLASIRDRG